MFKGKQVGTRATLAFMQKPYKKNIKTFKQNIWQEKVLYI